MIHLVIGLVSFVAIFGGALGGIFAASRLPCHHLSGQTQSAITVSFAVIGTLAALVLGLMVTAANHSFSARTDEVRELSLQVVRIDRNLRRYGPEGEDARGSCTNGYLPRRGNFFRRKANRGPQANKPSKCS